MLCFIGYSFVTGQLWRKPSADVDIPEVSRDVRWIGSGVDGGNGQGGLFQNVQQHLHGVQSGEHSYVVFRGDLADLQTVVLVGGGILGVDHIGDMALTQCIGDLLAAVADFGQLMSADAVGLQEAGSTLGGFDVEAQLVEPADQGQRLFLVRIGDVARTVP